MHACDGCDALPWLCGQYHCWTSFHAHIPTHSHFLSHSASHSLSLFPLPPLRILPIVTMLIMSCLPFLATQTLLILSVSWARKLKRGHFSLFAYAWYYWCKNWIGRVVALGYNFELIKESVVISIFFRFSCRWEEVPGAGCCVGRQKQICRTGQDSPGLSEGARTNLLQICKHG